MSPKRSFTSFFVDKRDIPVFQLLGQLLGVKSRKSLRATFILFYFYFLNIDSSKSKLHFPHPCKGMRICDKQKISLLYFQNSTVDFLFNTQDMNIYEYKLYGLFTGLLTKEVSSRPGRTIMG
jgi:hypothetical protein